MKIHKIAVLGSGVMGGQIAALFANAHLPVLLYGFENHLEKEFTAISKLKPSAYTLVEKSSWITPLTYENDLEQLHDCDLVIEAIVEKLDVKLDLFHKVLPHLKDDAVLASNTSSLSIQAMIDGLQKADSQIGKRFIGIHFFNPPRYMSLVELIPSPLFDHDQLQQLEDFFTSELGKNIVYSQDVTGFIANRIGVFSMAACIHHAEQLGLGFDTVDALTGTKLKRPKSATFRTADLVGLDIMHPVFDQFYTQLLDDPWHSYFATPAWLQDLLEDGALGNKTKRGIYQKIDGEIHVYDPSSKTYRKADYHIDDDVKAMLKLPMTEQLASLRESKHPQAQFVYRSLRDSFLYAAYHLPQIGDSTRDVDLAMRWGFGWNLGIFEYVQQQGLHAMLELFHLDNDGAPVPIADWLTTCLGFYSNRGAWSVNKNDYVDYPDSESYQRQLYPPHLMGEAERDHGTTILENDSARLWHQGDGIAIFSLKSKMHTLNLEAVQALQESIDIAEKDYQALVVWQEEAPFSAGANLYEIFAAAKLGQIETTSIMSKVKQKLWQTFQSDLPKVDHLPSILEILDVFQKTLMRLKYSHIPTVAAVQGLAMGGGCELLIHCDRRVVARESYIGLVEAGVGLLPAGGGCKEMARRAAAQGDFFPTLAKHFEQVGMAKVATSAEEAQFMGYLTEQDVILAQPLELLYEAKRQAKQLVHSHYRPENEQAKFQVGGTTAKANIMAQITNLQAGHFISEHDALIGERIAEVMTGGGVAPGTLVTSQYLLDLEREHFADLLRTELTQARIEYMLKHHKPLRN